MRCPKLFTFITISTLPLLSLAQPPQLYADQIKWIDAVLKQFPQYDGDQTNVWNYHPWVHKYLEDPRVKPLATVQGVVQEAMRKWVVSTITQYMLQTLAPNMAFPARFFEKSWPESPDLKDTSLAMWYIKDPHDPGFVPDGKFEMPVPDNEPIDGGWKIPQQIYEVVVKAGENSGSFLLHTATGEKALITFMVYAQNAFNQHLNNPGNAIARPGRHLLWDDSDNAGVNVTTGDDGSNKPGPDGFLPLNFHEKLNYLGPGDGDLPESVDKLG